MHALSKFTLDFACICCVTLLHFAKTKTKKHMETGIVFSSAFQFVICFEIRFFDAGVICSLWHLMLNTEFLGCFNLF